VAKVKIPEVEELSQGTQQFLDVLNDEDDLAVIVISASYLDACLAAMLKRRLRAGSTSDRLLDSQRGVLGSFATRADLSYALELIGKEIYQDLIKTAEIRNSVAHNHLALSFATIEVAEVVATLKYVEHLFGKTGIDPSRFKQDLSIARNRFVMTVVLISQRLLVSGLSIQPPSGPSA
jgi:DNA-binding MltR family transcriptional regulator